MTTPPRPPGTSEPGAGLPGIILPGSIPGAETGNGRGYCPDGFAIGDTRAGLTAAGSISIFPVSPSPITLFSMTPVLNVLYPPTPLRLNTYVGYKFAAESQRLIDPWTCEPLALTETSPPTYSVYAFFYEPTFGGSAYLIEPLTGAFIKRSDLTAGRVDGGGFIGVYVDPITGLYIPNTGSNYQWAWSYNFWHGLGGDGGTSGIWYPPPTTTTGGPPPPLPTPVPPVVAVTAVSAPGPIITATVSWNQSQSVSATNYRLLLYAADGTTLLATTPITPFPTPVIAGTTVDIPWDLRGPTSPRVPYALQNSTSYKLVASLFATTIGEQDTSAPFSFSTAWTPPAAATGLTLTPVIPEGKVRADWANPGGIAGNRIYWRLTGKPDWNLIYDGPAITTKTVKLPVGASLDVRVTTVDSNNVESVS